MEKVTKHWNRLSRDSAESSTLEMCKDKSMWHLWTWPSDGPGSANLQSDSVIQIVSNPDDSMICLEEK